MATTQYIGARYVPIIVGEWDKTRTYEPLMVVTYQGASYTSRQYVPAGIEITNESYWVLSANYNAQIEAYRKEVRGILPYDEMPTEGSTKGVTSDGIKKAINAEKTRAEAAEQTLQNGINAIAPFDTTPIEGSVKGVTSGGIYSALNNVVPSNGSVTSEKLANGSVTSEKLSSDALTSLIHGMSIRRFGNAGGTDNDGLVLPSGNTINVVLDGLYVPELTLLLICDFEITNSSTDTPYQSTVILPSYIPHITITGSAIIGGCVEWNSTNNFVSWHSVRLFQDGSNLKLALNTNDMTNSCASMGTCAILLRGYGAE